MSERSSTPKGANAVALDLHSYGETLARLLPVLLFTPARHSLVEWCRVRSWVDNALAGDAAPDLQTIELAVASLVDRTLHEAWRRPFSTGE